MVLRFHLLREVTNHREISARAAVDALLAFYGILEIGFLCGAISELPPSIEQRARRHLSRPAVRRYYETFYPLLLPRLLLARLNSGSRFGFPGGDSVTPFTAFLTLNMILDDQDVKKFLWLLDGGRVSNCDITSLLQLLLNSTKLTSRVLRPPSKQTTADQALHGFVKFCGFCFELDKLLRDPVPPLLVRSAMWHFHAYWFGQIGSNLLGVISTAIEQYHAWVPRITAKTSPADRMAIERTQSSMNQAQQALQRLTSSFYRFPLEELALRRWRVELETGFRTWNPITVQLGSEKLRVQETGLWDFPSLET